MASLTGQEGNFDYPGFDYAAQRTKIARKLALSQALQKQGLEQLPVDRQVGGWAIKTSPLEGLAKLAQTYVGAKIGKGVETDQTDLAKTAQSDYRTALSTALKNSGLGQEEIDSLTAAGSNPMAQQMMPFITGIAQQKRQMKMLQDWLGQGGQGVPGAAPEAPAGPQPGEGQGYGVVAPPAPGTQPAPPIQGGMGQMPVGARNVMGGAMLGIPGLSKIGEMQFEQSKPLNLRPGSTAWSPTGGVQFSAPDLSQGAQIQQGPNGPSAVPIPGLADISANMAATKTTAEERAKAPFAMETYNTPGAPTVMTRQQAIEQATGRPMPGSPIPQGAPGMPIPSAPQSGTPQPPITGKPLAIPGLRLQDQGESARQKQLGETQGSIQGDIYKGADTARNLITQSGFMRNALQQIKAAGGQPGAAAPIVQSLTQWAQAMKINPAELGLPKDAGPYQYMDSITNRMAMGMIGPGGMPANNFSEADRNFVVATMGRKTDTEQGLQFKADVVEKMARRAMEAEQSLLKAEQQGKTFNQWRQDWTRYANENPVFKGAKAQSQGSQQMPEIGKVINGYRFKGGNPNDLNSWEYLKK